MHGGLQSPPRHQHVSAFYLVSNIETRQDNTKNICRLTDQLTDTELATFMCSTCSDLHVCHITYATVFELTYYLMFVRSCFTWFMALGLWSRGVIQHSASPRAVSATWPHLSCHKSHNALLANIKWFIVVPWLTLSCALTFDSVCWQFLLILHGQYNTQVALDYKIYGRGGAFDVAHKVTIKYCIVRLLWLHKQHKQSLVAGRS